MKVKNVLIVGILFLGLLAYIISFEIPHSEQKRAESKPFYNVGKAQVVDLEVKRNSESFKLVNSRPKSAPPKSKLDKDQAGSIDGVVPSDWTIEGLAYPQVNPTILNAILTQLSAFELGTALPSADLGADLSLFGLSEPEVVLKIERLDEYGSKKQLKFEFGKKSDFLGKRYVRFTRNDGTSDIFLTDDLLFFALNKEVKEFRKKDPISFSDADLTKLELSDSDLSKNVVLEKKPSTVPGFSEERWKISSPLSAWADQNKISDLLKNLKDLKAKDYLDGDAKAQLFLTPKLIATLYKKGAENNSLIVKVASEKEGDKDRTFFSINGIPTIFEAEANPANLQFEDPSSYRQTKFFDIEADDVISFDLGGTMVIPLKGEKKEDNWEIGDKAGDEVFIRQWLLNLKDLKAQSFPNEAKDFGFAAPAYKLSLKIGDLLAGPESKPIERVLVIGAAESIEDGRPKTYYAAVDNLADPFIISAEDLAKISPKVESLLQVPTVIPTEIPTLVATQIAVTTEAIATASAK